MQLERPPPARVAPVADGQVDLGPLAGLVAGRRGGRVDDLGEARLLDAGLEQAPHKPDAVSRRAAAGGVRGVEEEHRPAVDRPSPRDGLGDRDGLDLVGAPLVPEAAGEPLGLGRGEGRIAVGHDDGAAAHVGRIDVGADQEGRSGEDAVALVECRGLAEEPRVGRVGECRAVERGQDQRQLRVRDHRTTSPATARSRSFAARRPVSRVSSCG